MRKLIMTAALAALVAAVALTALPAAAKPPGANGRIVFGREDPALGDTVLYTINPDGTHLQQLFTPTVTGEVPHWSPDGTRIDVSCCNLAAFLINPDTNSNAQLPMPDPTLFTGCSVWSPDGTRLACESFGDDPSRNGIYTIRSSDGGGLTQLTSNPGGDDSPGDYSPDGTKLVFDRQDPTRPANAQQALFVVNVDGSGLRQITPWGLPSGPEFVGLSWSPDGKWILFAGGPVFVGGSLYVVHPDGSGLSKIPLAGPPGVTRAFQPAWSPDGTKIVFGLSTHQGPGTGQEGIYIANSDGSNVQQVTSSPTFDQWTDWGTHPLIH
jgi:Tol biopolymer transport system component